VVTTALFSIVNTVVTPWSHRGHHVIYTVVTTVVICHHHANLVISS
jgi:hypothetical protein